MESLRTGIEDGLYIRSPAGHVVAGYDRVLNTGLDGIIKSTQAENSTGDFRNAASIVTKAATDYILRYAAKA